MNLRSEPRRTCIARITVENQIGETQGALRETLIEDISARGMGFHSMGRVEVGSTIRGTFRNKPFEGTVRHCNPHRKGGYYVGIELTT